MSSSLFPNFQVGVVAVIGVTEFKSEFSGMLDLHLRLTVVY